MTAKQIIQREIARLVGDMQHFCAGHGVQHFAGKVARRADAAGTVFDLYRARLCQRNQLFHIAHRERGMDDNHIRRDADQADR